MFVILVIRVFCLGIFCGLAGLKAIWNIQQALWDMDE